VSSGIRSAHLRFTDYGSAPECGIDGGIHGLRCCRAPRPVDDREISATVFHISRGEMSSALVTAIRPLLVAFVAYARWKVLPIRPRTVA